MIFEKINELLDKLNLEGKQKQTILLLHDILLNEKVNNVFKGVHFVSFKTPPYPFLFFLGKYKKEDKVCMLFCNAEDTFLHSPMRVVKNYSSCMQYFI